MSSRRRPNKYFRTRAPDTGFGFFAENTGRIMKLQRKDYMLPYEIEITYRRRVRHPQLTKFFETIKIKGPKWRVRYFYVGNTVLKFAGKFD